MSDGQDLIRRELRRLRSQRNRIAESMEPGPSGDTDRQTEIKVGLIQGINYRIAALRDELKGHADG